jgi:hypothetical protein
LAPSMKSAILLEAADMKVSRGVVNVIGAARTAHPGHAVDSSV